MLCSLELHVTTTREAALGYIFGKCYSSSDTMVMSHKAWPIQCKSEPMCLPNVFPVATIPSSVGSDSYHTWLRFVAQFWACWAWALSVSCLSVLLSTVTLPSPICLMNRRNYTTTKKITAKKHLPLLICQVYTSVCNTSFTPIQPVSFQRLLLKPK